MTWPGDPVAAGRILAEAETLDFVARRISEMEASARANEPHADRIEPDWQVTMDAKRARLEQMRDGLDKSIAGTRKAMEEAAHG
jgi:hypothetical protein